MKLIATGRERSQGVNNTKYCSFMKR